MTPNFIPTFTFDQPVEVIDDTGFTIATGRVTGRHDTGDPTDDRYIITLNKPHQGCKSFPAGWLQATKETRPTTNRRNNNHSKGRH